MMTNVNIISYSEDNDDSFNCSDYDDEYDDYFSSSNEDISFLPPE